MLDITIKLKDLKSTANLGKLLSEHLKITDIVLLDGPMGSGKTTLIKTIISCFGIESNKIVSPTYTIVNIYQNAKFKGVQSSKSVPFSINHVDLYRLTSSQAVDAFEYSELISTDGLTFIEWPDFINSWFKPEEVLVLHWPNKLNQIPEASENERTLKITGDDRYLPLFTALNKFK